VQSVYDVEPEIEQKVLDKLDSFVAETNGRAAEVQTHVRVGNGAPSNIAEFVEDQAIDLVSMSTHGRTGLDRFLLGSVAEKVVRHVQCPVLTVKAFRESIVSAGSGNGAKIGDRRPPSRPSPSACSRGRRGNGVPSRSRPCVHGGALRTSLVGDRTRRVDVRLPDLPTARAPSIHLY